MPLYVIEMPGLDFTGARGGVDFFLGKGTTSSRADAQRLAGLGYLVLEIDSKKPSEGAVDAAPSDFTPSPAERAARAEREESRQRQDAVERDPNSDWSKKRAEAARKQAKRRKVHR